MTKKVRIQGPEVAFPRTCVVCSAPADQSFQVQRIFTYGKRNITITLPVPMCSAHYDMAKTKSPAEKMSEKAGLIAGLVLAVIVAGSLLVWWNNTGQGNLILNIFIGLIAGAGFGMVLWAALAFWIAPMFASPESRLARHAVKLTRFYPGNNVLELEFANEQMAQGFTRENSSRLAS